MENKKAQESQVLIASVFKRIVANIIDIIVAAIGSVVLLFPLSGQMYRFGANDWVPFFLFGGLYFVLFESVFWKQQTIGRTLMKIRLETLDGQPLKPWISFLRYFLLCLPNYNGQVSNLIARTVGITDTRIGGTVYLIIVGILFAGNTLFLLFHKHKRGLHDVICNTVMVKSKSDSVKSSPKFTTASAIAGVAMFAVLALVFGSLLGTADKDPDFSDVSDLNKRIKTLSPVKIISASYNKFSMGNDQKWFSIQAHVYIPQDKDSDEYKKELSEKLFPAIKLANQNEKVTRIEIIYHAKKFIGAFPVETKSIDTKEISDIQSVK